MQAAIVSVFLLESFCTKIHVPLQDDKKKMDRLKYNDGDGQKSCGDCVDCVDCVGCFDHGGYNVYNNYEA